METFTFSKGDYKITIYAWNELAAKCIWESLQKRNYYPTSGRVRQVHFGYEILT